MRDSHSLSSLESIEETLPPMEAIRTNQGSKSQKGAEAANDLHLVQSHLSHHDMPVTTEFREVDAEQYLRFSPARKVLIVFVLSFCSFLAPISSTSILSGIPEVAKTYNTSGSVINASNALYLAFMGVSAPFWGPFSQVWGRRPVSVSPHNVQCISHFHRKQQVCLYESTRSSLQALFYSSFSVSARPWHQIYLHTTSSEC
jgi:hypothetical protein